MYPNFLDSGPRYAGVDPGLLGITIEIWNEL